MKILKNRMIIGSLCIVLAILIGFFAVPLMISITNKKVEVVVASQNIPVGVMIEEEMIVVNEMFASDIPPGAGLSTSDVIGAYSTVEIVQDDVISNRKISKSFPYTDEALYDIPVGLYAISVTTDSLSSSVAGKIKPGDIITILVKSKQDETTGDMTAKYFPELMYMKLLNVTTDIGSDIQVVEHGQAAEDVEPPLPAVVTLLCNLEQAQMLAGFEENASIHIALTARGTSGNAEEYLGRQAEFFLTRDEDRRELEEQELDDQEEQENLEEENLDDDENEEGEESELEESPKSSTAAVASSKAPSSTASKAVSTTSSKATTSKATSTTSSKTASSKSSSSTSSSKGASSVTPRPRGDNSPDQDSGQ